MAQEGYALRFASDELKADRQVVLAAVAQHGLALQHASSALRNDREVVLAAVLQHGEALVHASAELQVTMRRAALPTEPSSVCAGRISWLWLPAG